MKKITASRISDGNKLFPASITIEDSGLKVRLPGFWKDEETFVSYSDISGVEVQTPLVGYSTIEFNVMGSRVRAHGFTKSEVREVKDAIDAGKRKGPAPSTTQTIVMSSGANTSQESPLVVNKAPGLGHFLGKTMNESFASLMSQGDKFDQEKQRKADQIETLACMKLANSPDELLEQMNYLSALISSKPEKEVRNVIIEKMEFGIMRLRTAGCHDEAIFFERKLEPLKKNRWF